MDKWLCAVDVATDDEFTGPVNLGDPREFTIREVAEKVVEMTGSRSKLIEKPLPADDPMQRQPDIGLPREKLDWSPAVELKTGWPRRSPISTRFSAMMRS